MNQIQIITDAGSDIVDCSRTDLTVLPMTIRFGDEEYLDGVNLTHRQFYEKMIETQELPTTSQPSPYAFEAAIRKIHEQGDIALIITISSKLALPARSPMPLMVHSTCVAPALTAASELATAKPRSSWQWVEISTFSTPSTCFAR